LEANALVRAFTVDVGERVEERKSNPWRRFCIDITLIKEFKLWWCNMRTAKNKRKHISEV
jgi:hypothetical protein